jgi:hypothetical protein
VNRISIVLRRNTAGEESTLLPWIIGVTIGFMILLLITVTYLKKWRNMLENVEAYMDTA